MKDLSTLAAVRERLEAMRYGAETLRSTAAVYATTGSPEQAEGFERMALYIEWAANALEAVLEYAPCVCGPHHNHRDGKPCGYSITMNGEVESCSHANRQLPAWLEAALTRATATTEGAK